ncbi:hypothetical protein N7462_005634 [Penicillium macrosclerotiorum]|uniref:uncharacterized protein n=1 Tax=Penicillium macrosclerotiorum TaxID=303699 RepID=UPI0025487D4F|nr:uncharacterized protein N7462_005634 [Penicillium macrosclerotiorum]KAJ5682469.1 hypothetical protein N7462_005634 [Penicillium macrosclerotiorum]
MYNERQLRSTIRAPMRYGEAEAESTTSDLLRSMHESREKIANDEPLQELAESSASSRKRQRHPSARPYVPEFNPNLPPAAFPSLTCVNESVPQGTREDHLRALREEREKKLPRAESNFPQQEELSTVSVVKKPVKNECRAFTVLGIQASPSSSTRKPASTIEQRIRTAGFQDQHRRFTEDSTPKWPGGDGIYLSFSDSDLDESSFVHRDERENRPNPKWSDLSTSLQAEIMDNLLEEITWECACQKLGFSRREQKRAEEALEKRNRQRDKEDMHLRIMRDKQLKQLMRMDKSVKCQVSDKFALQKISRSAFRNLILNTRQNLLSCKKSELHAAWRFLEQRKLPTILAGDLWSNGEKTIRPYRYIQPGTKKLKYNKGPYSHLKAPESPTPDQLIERAGIDYSRVYEEPRGDELAMGAGKASNPLVTPVNFNLTTAYREAQREQTTSETWPDQAVEEDGQISTTARDVPEQYWEHIHPVEQDWAQLARSAKALGLDPDHPPHDDHNGEGDLDDDAISAMLEKVTYFNEKHQEAFFDDTDDEVELVPIPKAIKHTQSGRKTKARRCTR